MFRFVAADYAGLIFKQSVVESSEFAPVEERSGVTSNATALDTVLKVEK